MHVGRARAVSLRCGARGTRGARFAQPRRHHSVTRLHREPQGVLPLERHSRNVRAVREQEHHELIKGVMTMSALAAFTSAPRARSSRATSMRLFSLAHKRGVMPSLLRAAFTSAPCASSSRTKFTWPNSLAHIRDVMPSVMRAALASAPRASSSRASFTWLPRLASTRHVTPLDESLVFTCAPLASSSRTFFKLPWSHAKTSESARTPRTAAWMR